MVLPTDPRQMELSSRLSALLDRRDFESDPRRGDLEAMARLAASNQPAFDRDFFAPGHFTASAFVLSPDRESLLLIFHKKLRMWLQPGGHIEPEDHDLVAAARREVEEETGLRELDVEYSYFDFDVHRIPAHGDAPEHLHHDVRCLFASSALAVTANHEVADARWFSLRAVCEHGEHLADGFGTDESVRRVARRLIGMRSR